MNDEINLISGKKQFIERQEKIVHTFRIVAYSSLSAVALISVLLFLLNFYSPLPKVIAQQQKVSQDLLAQKTKITKLLLLRDRLQHITTIFQQSTSLENTLAAIVLNTPGNVEIDTLGVNKDSVTIIFTSLSLSSMNDFMDFLSQQISKKTLFKKATISSLAFDAKTGIYTLTVGAVPL
jgi:hypothetical protein